MTLCEVDVGEPTNAMLAADKTVVLTGYSRASQHAPSSILQKIGLMSPAKHSLQNRPSNDMDDQSAFWQVLSSPDATRGRTGPGPSPYEYFAGVPSTVTK